MTTSTGGPAVSPAALAAALGRPAPTQQQAEVIAAPAEPTLVVAGAGSGKTETIAQRVVYVVANGFARPGEILGLTFTRKAAGELATRIRTRLRAVAAAGVGDPRALQQCVETQPTIGTYHAFAGDVIAEFGPLVGIEPTSRVLTPTATWQLARDVVRRWDADLDTDHSAERVTQDILDVSSALSDHLVDVDALDDELERIIGVLRDAPPTARQKGPVHSDIRSALTGLIERRTVLPLVREFVRAKRSARVLDFADQMQLAARIVAVSAHAGDMLRARYPLVFLDEYQDTGHSQRAILRGLFGQPERHVATAWRGHAVTAVGDPVQSIYSWRGAAASNLPRFTTDFPLADGSPARRRELLVSFRNDRRILDIANAVSEPVRHTPVAVGTLEPAATAGDGEVTAALLPTVDEENQWLAETLAQQWFGSPRPPTVAVLLRRRAAMAGIAQALRAHGLPVDVVGVGGLIDEPEVADIIAMLRMVVDHQSGPAAVRILTGARWQLGVADLAALARRARHLGPAADRGRTAADAGGSDALAAMRAALSEALDGDDVDEAGLVDALADPGDGSAYSQEGLRRITELSSELRRLRGRLSAPLTDLVRDIERALRLDVEILLTPDGRAHVDAFADIVADLAQGGAGPVELLDYLAVAAEREDGLAPGEVDVVPGRVQVLTVHAAKGLEWDVVAVPHLSAGVFPSGMSSVWIGEASSLPPSLRGDRDDVPGLLLTAGADQGGLGRQLKGHRAQWRDRHLIEERRLFYVAVTRARRHVLLSAHHWSATRKEPAGPGEFFTEIVECGDGPSASSVAAGADDARGGSRRAAVTPVVCAPPPEAGARNPLLDQPMTGTWPIDPLGARRPAVEKGARLVRRAMARTGPDMLDPDDPTDPNGWFRDVPLLLAERAAASAPPESIDVGLPSVMSVSSLVELASDPEGLARRIRRPIPRAPSPQARRGTAFHAWLERYYGGEPLLDIADLPGAHDVHAADDEQLDALIDAFRDSPWAARSPIAVEIPFVTHVAGVAVRGRIDAVFADPDGGVCVVDWKTGTPPTADQAESVAIQLVAYRLAWSRLHRMPLAKVRAAFYYVAHRRTITPADLLEETALERLLDDAVGGAAPGAARTDPPVAPT